MHVADQCCSGRVVSVFEEKCGKLSVPRKKHTDSSNIKSESANKIDFGSSIRNEFDDFKDLKRSTLHDPAPVDHDSNKDDNNNNNNNVDDTYNNDNSNGHAPVDHNSNKDDNNNNNNNNIDDTYNNDNSNGSNDNSYHMTPSASTTVFAASHVRRLIDPYGPHIYIDKPPHTQTQAHALRSIDSSSGSSSSSGSISTASLSISASRDVNQSISQSQSISQFSCSDDVITGCIDNFSTSSSSSSSSSSSCSSSASTSSSSFLSFIPQSKLNNNLLDKDVNSSIDEKISKKDINILCNSSLSPFDFCKMQNKIIDDKYIINDKNDS